MPPIRRIKFNQTRGPNGITLENWCDTEINIHKTNYLWIIHDYNVHQATLPEGECLKSPVFSATTNKQCKWRLAIYPNGDGDKAEKSKILKKNDFSLYLSLDFTSECESALANFKLSILKENKEVLLSRNNSTIRKFEADDDDKCDWGFYKFIDDDYELPSDNKLMIYCEIEIFAINDNTDNISHSHSIDRNIHEVRLSEDLGQLLKNEEFSDVVISVKGKQFKAHKSILSTRSPVFAAMFKHSGMKENQQNKVKIKDFDQPTVQEMLNYIYTGRSENLDELADRLLVIAEKYGLDGLKETSEKTLVENLSLNNAINMLIFADLHQAQKLRSSAISFIVEKSAQFMKTSAWKNMVVTYPQLVVEVCEALTSKLPTNL